MKSLDLHNFIGAAIIRTLFLCVLLIFNHTNCTSGSGETNKFLIVVGYSLYKTGLLTIPLEVYRSDIYNQDWEASMITVSRTDPNADYVCQDETILKSVLKSYYQAGFKGFVLIGSNDIPVVWWRCRYSDPNGCDPTDLYYSDLDEWKSKKDSIYVSYNSEENFVGFSFGPEMFCGRICAGGITDSVNEEAVKVAFYLDKIHQYRENKGNLTEDQKDRALIFLHSDSYNHKNIDSWPENAICNDLHTLCDDNVTNSLNFISEIEKGYRFVNIRAHSGHDYNGFISTDILSAIKPKFNFLNLFGCGACTYTTENFGAVYLFDNDYSLNITGSTGGWGVSPDEKFYRDLSEGEPVGIAFQAFINRDLINKDRHPPDGEVGWPKGVLLGDPLLTYTSEIKSYMTPTILTDLTNQHADVGHTFNLKLSVNNPDLRGFQYKINNLPQDATFANNTIIWTPPFGSDGIHYIEIKAVDDIEGEYSEIFTITVNSHSDKLLNGGFEEGINHYLEAWFPDYFCIYRWDSTGVAQTGARSLYFYVPEYQQAIVRQIVQLRPETNYVLTGWIKGKNITASAVTHPECKLKGAAIIVEQYMNNTYSIPGITGTFDWTPDSFVFRTPENGIVSIAATLGYCSGETTGEVWYDDIKVYPQNDNSLKEEQILQEIKIFPNPSGGDFYVGYFSTKEQEIHVVLTNLMGQTVYSETFLSFSGSDRKKISIN
jgi:hypothetical protein